MKAKMLYLVLGTLFGFLLSRAGASTFDFHARLFLFEDLQLLWVIAAAILTGMTGFKLLKITNAKSLIGNISLVLRGKSMQPKLIQGALMMGVGWGLTGSCPGTAPVMLGEGKLATAFTLAGVLIGTYIFGKLSSKNKPELDPET